MKLTSEAMILRVSMDNIMEKVVKTGMTPEAIKKMAPGELELMQDAIKLVSAANDYFIAEAKKLDDIDSKLDLLLKKRES